MKYMELLNLINLSIRCGILREQDDMVFVYRNKGKNVSKGWFLESKTELAKDLMMDSFGQSMLIDALKKQGIDFKVIKK